MLISVCLIVCALIIVDFVIYGASQGVLFVKLNVSAENRGATHMDAEDVHFGKDRADADR